MDSQLFSSVASQYARFFLVFFWYSVKASSRIELKRVDEADDGEGEDMTEDRLFVRDMGD